MLYRCETWSVEDEDVARLEMNDLRMVRKMCNVRSEDRTSTEEFITRMKSDSTRECLQDKRLQ